MSDFNCNKCGGVIKLNIDLSGSCQSCGQFFTSDEIRGRLTAKAPETPKSSVWDTLPKFTVPGYNAPRENDSSTGFHAAASRGFPSVEAPKSVPGVSVPENVSSGINAAVTIPKISSPESFPSVEAPKSVPGVSVPENVSSGINAAVTIPEISSPESFPSVEAPKSVPGVSVPENVSSGINAAVTIPKISSPESFPSVEAPKSVPGVSVPENVSSGINAAVTIPEISKPESVPAAQTVPEKETPAAAPKTAADKRPAALPEDGFPDRNALLNFFANIRTLELVIRESEERLYCLKAAKEELRYRIPVTRTQEKSAPLFPPGAGADGRLFLYKDPVKHQKKKKEDLPSLIFMIFTLILSFVILSRNSRMTPMLLMVVIIAAVVVIMIFKKRVKGGRRELDKEKEINMMIMREGLAKNSAPASVIHEPAEPAGMQQMHALIARTTRIRNAEDLLNGDIRACRMALDRAYAAGIVPERFRGLECASYIYERLSQSGLSFAAILAEAEPARIKQDFSEGFTSMTNDMIHAAVRETLADSKPYKTEMFNRQLREAESLYADEKELCAKYAAVRELNSGMMMLFSEKQPAYMRPETAV